MNGSNLPDRFWDKVDAEGPCWIWTAFCHQRSGHGVTKLPGTGNKKHYAHLLVWRDLVGPILEGKVLDHLCMDPSCVNPDHLEPVTQLVNVRRGRSPSALKWRQRQLAAAA